MKKFKGFTLAEVLITLGIIGVVAAMTIPNIIKNSQKKELHAGLLKSYSTLQQALLRTSQSNGEVIQPSNFNVNNFIENLNYEKYCTGQCYIKYAPPYQINEYLTYDKKQNINTMYFDDGQILLQDGSLIMIERWYIPVLFTVDVNGHKKKPNVWGYDLFTFQLMNDGKLLPMGMEGTQFNAIDYCSKKISNGNNGIACTEKAINDKNYWKEL